MDDSSTKNLIQNSETVVNINVEISTKRKRKLEYLDSIRGLAALWVAIHHVLAAFEDIFGMEFMLKLQETFFYRMIMFYWARVAVMIFFVLSGRVLPISYLATGYNTTLVSACVRRVFRLGFPVLAAMIMAKLIHASGILVCTNYCSGLHYGSRWTGAINYVPHENYSIRRIFELVINMFVYQKAPFHQAGVLWTLPHEWTNSFYIYIFAFIYKNLPHGQGFFLMCLTVLSLFKPNWNSPFALGFLLAVLEENGILSLVRNSKNRVFNLLKLLVQFGCMFFFVALNGLRWFDGYFDVIDRTLYGDSVDAPHFLNLICAFGVMIVAETSSLGQRILDIKPLLFLGRISFGLYLMHGPMLPLFPICIATFSNLDWSKSLAFGTSAVIFLVASLVVAYIFTVLIDEQSVKLTALIYKTLFANANFGFRQFGAVKFYRVFSFLARHFPWFTWNYERVREEED